LASPQVGHAYSPKNQVATYTDPIEDRYGSIEVDNRGGVITKLFARVWTGAFDR